MGTVFPGLLRGPVRTALEAVYHVQNLRIVKNSLEVYRCLARLVIVLLRTNMDPLRGKSGKVPDC